MLIRSQAAATADPSVTQADTWHLTRRWFTPTTARPLAPTSPCCWQEACERLANVRSSIYYPKTGTTAGIPSSHSGITRVDHGFCLTHQIASPRDPWVTPNSPGIQYPYQY